MKINPSPFSLFLLGVTKFGEEISEMLGRRVIPGKARRPRKKSVILDEEIFHNQLNLKRIIRKEGFLVIRAPKNAKGDPGK